MSVPPRDPLCEEDRQLLARVIRTLAPLPDGEWQAFLSGFSSAALGAGEQLLRVGERATWIGVVAEGLLREYYPMPSGDEYTRVFCPPGFLTGSLYDLLSTGPSITSIEAVEPSRVLLLPYAAFEGACARNPLWHQVARRAAEGAYRRKVRREFEMLSMDAVARYAALRHELGELEPRIPQRHLASFLGITPEHLSRVRKKLREDAPLRQRVP